MSAFMVSNGSLNIIATHIAGDLAAQGAYVHGVHKALAASGYGEENAADLMQDLYDLNAKSIEARYGEGEVENFTGGEVYKYSPIKRPAMQVYKSIRCYLYQSCEGDCMDSELYGLINDYGKQLAEEIVQSLPEYNKANWD